MSQETANLYLPAEWHEQEFVQLTWPHEKSDWAYMLQEVEECFTNLAKAISRRGKLLIVTPCEEKTRKTLQEHGATMENISFFTCDTNDTWARDHAFITLLGDDGPHFLDFCFNGWGKKFEASLDTAINRKLHDAGIVKGIYHDLNHFVLEGGSIESDGNGTLLTTTCCLTAPNRNTTDKGQLEEELCSMLHCERVLWLDHGELVGDDTDGHIDTLARLTPDDTIVYMQYSEEDSEEYDCLKKMEEQLATFVTKEGKPYRLLPLPSPAPIYDEEGLRLPATYANFLIMNGAVLYPTYAQPGNDAKAAEVLKTAFPNHEIVGIDCRALIKQHGSLHCVTMQYPLNKQ